MRMIIINTTAIAVSTLLLAACSGAETDSSTSPTASPSTSPAASASASASVEQTEPQARVSITSESGVEVFSLANDELESLANFPTEAPVRAVVGPDARHLYLVDAEASTTSVLDTGSYSQGHGDHFHYYTREPDMRPDVIEGDRPVHVVGHGGRVSIFNDGDGSVDTFDEVGLVSGGLQVEEASAELPHHGVAVPVEDGILITESSDGELPSTIRQTDASGATVATYEDVCEGLHGEASVGHQVVFGCADSIVVIDPEEQTSTSIPNPAGAGEARIGSLYPGGHTLVGNWSESAFTVIHLDEKEITPVATDAPVAAIARGSEGEIIVLSTDGVVTVHDDHGTVVSTTEALEAFTLPEGHGGERPSVAVAGENLIIADPAGNQVLVVSIASGEVVATHSLDYAPLGVAVTGLPPVTHDEAHDDAHDEAHDHEGEAGHEDEHSDEEAHDHEEESHAEEDGHDH